MNKLLTFVLLVFCTFVEADVSYTVPSSTWTIVRDGRTVLCTRGSACNLPEDAVYSQTSLTATGRYSTSYVSCTTIGCASFTTLAAAVDNLSSVMTDGMTNLSDRLTLDARGLKAFPGAEGGGQDSVGGRGGALWVVDDYGCETVQGDGKKTLSEGVQRLGDASGVGALTIVFEIGGLFPCLDVLTIPGGDVSTASTNPSYWEAVSNTTIACQSAPAPGVHIALWKLEIKQDSHVKMRGCNIYGVDINGESASVFRVVGSGDSSHIICDRCGLFNNVDDVLLGFIGSGSSGLIEHTSLTNSMIMEGDAYSTHPEASPGDPRDSHYLHAMGAGCSTSLEGATLSQGVFDCSFIGNLFFEAERRGPQFWDASGHVLNNFMYNAGTAGISIAAVALPNQRAAKMDVYVENNIMYYGPSTRFSEDYPESGGLRASGFSSDHKVSILNNSRVLLGTSALTAYPTRTATPDAARARPLSEAVYHPVRDWMAGISDGSAFTCLGPREDHKSADVARMIGEIATRTGEIGIGTVYGDPDLADGDHGRLWLNEDGADILSRDISNNPAVANNYFGTGAWPASYDTDADGMQDAWETANGLNVGVQDHNADLDSDGYDNIEEFLAYRARCS